MCACEREWEHMAAPRERSFPAFMGGATGSFSGGDELVEALLRPDVELKNA